MSEAAQTPIEQANQLREERQFSAALAMLTLDPAGIATAVELSKLHRDITIAIKGKPGKQKIQEKPILKKRGDLTHPDNVSATTQLLQDIATALTQKLPTPDLEAWKALEAKTLVSLSHGYAVAGQADDALNAMHAAETAASENLKAAAASWRMLSDRFRAYDQYDAAFQAMQACERLDRQIIGDESQRLKGIAVDWGRQAEFFADKGQSDLAMRTMEHAENIFRELSPPGLKGAVIAWVRIRDTFAGNGQADAAIQAMTRVEAIDKEIDAQNLQNGTASPDYKDSLASSKSAWKKLRDTFVDQDLGDHAVVAMREYARIDGEKSNAFNSDVMMGWLDLSRALSSHDVPAAIKAQIEHLNIRTALPNNNSSAIARNYCALASLYFKNDDTPNALAAAQQALTYEPTSKFALTQGGYYALLLGQTGLAIQYSKSVTQESPGDFAAGMTLTRAYVSQGELHDAQQAFAAITESTDSKKYRLLDAELRRIQSLSTTAAILRLAPSAVEEYFVDARTYLVEYDGQLLDKLRDIYEVYYPEMDPRNITRLVCQPWLLAWSNTNNKRGDYTVPASRQTAAQEVFTPADFVAGQVRAGRNLLNLLQGYADDDVATAFSNNRHPFLNGKNPKDVAALVLHTLAPTILTHQQETSTEQQQIVLNAPLTQPEARMQHPAVTAFVQQNAYFLAILTGLQNHLGNG